MDTTNTSSKRHKILTIIGIIMCVILVPILIVNCTLLVKSWIHKDEVPDFVGTVPLIVLTDSMYPDIKSGDLIICKTVTPEEVELGDVISFYDPAGNGTSVVTHKVIEVINEDGKISFKTKGINNNTEDRLPVPSDNLIAEYTGIRIPAAGNIAIFMQTTPGLIVCVILPIILLVGYDIIRRKIYEKNNKTDVAALMAELEALRSVQNAEGGMQNEEEMQNAEEVQKAECRMQNDDDEESNPIEDKSFAFAVRSVNLYKHLTENKREYILSKQFLRSSTSIGANVSEAERGQSKPDFISKMSIALKEANETEYWLRLLYASEYLNEAEFTSMSRDVNELISLLVAICKSASKNK